jgi:hypothetical protein
MISSRFPKKTKSAFQNQNSFANEEQRDRKSTCFLPGLGLSFF